jgi:hypothetical protein
MRASRVKSELLKQTRLAGATSGVLTQTHSSRRSRRGFETRPSSLSGKQREKDWDPLTSLNWPKNNRPVALFVPLATLVQPFTEQMHQRILRSPARTMGKWRNGVRTRFGTVT